MKQLSLFAAAVHLRRWIAWGGIAGGVCGLAIALIRQPRYQAATVVTPAGGASADMRLAGLVAQLGFSSGQPGGGQSLDYFVTLASAYPIASQLVMERVQLSQGTDTLLAAWLRPKDGDTPLRQERAVLALRRRVSVLPDVKSGVISIQAWDYDSSVARQVVRRVVRLVDSVAAEARRERAAFERQYTVARTLDIEKQLATAENSLAEFMKRNRDVVASPTLLLERERLNRRVELSEQVYLELMRAAEQSGFEELRTTPVLISVVPVYVPTLPLPRRRILIILLSGVLGVAAGVGIGVSLIRMQGESALKSVGDMDLAAEELRMVEWRNWRSVGRWVFVRREE